MTNTRPRVALDGQYSMTETAALLKIDRKTIYRWRKNGYLTTKLHRYTKMPFITGREILKVYDAFEWQEKHALSCAR